MTKCGELFNLSKKWHFYIIHILSHLIPLWNLQIINMRLSHFQFSRDMFSQIIALNNSNCFRSCWFGWNRGKKLLPGGLVNIPWYLLVLGASCPSSFSCHGSWRYAQWPTLESGSTEYLSLSLLTCFSAIEAGRICSHFSKLPYI